MKENSLLKKMTYAFLGMPLGIFTLEIFNLILSLTEGTYIRVDGNRLEIIVFMYIVCALSSYLGMLCVLNVREIREMSLGSKEKIKKFVHGKPNLIWAGLIMGVGIAISIVALVGDSKLEENIFFGVIAVSDSVLWLMIVLFVDELIFMKNKIKIRQINRKLK